MSIVLIDRSNGILRWMTERILVAAVISIPLALVMGRGAALFVGMLLIVLLSSEMALRLAGVVGKPVSFCLPGFRESLRRRYFYVALLMGLGVSIIPLSTEVFLPFSHEYTTALDLLGVCLEMMAAFLLGMVGCLTLGAYRIIFPRSVWHVLMFLAVLLPLGVPWVFGWAFEYPLISGPVCALACVLIWFRLGNMARVKETQRRTIEDARGEQTRIGTAQAPAPPGVDDSFRREMERRRYFGVTRYICGSFYETFGWLLSKWKWILAGVVAAAIVANFVRSGVIEFMFVLSGFFVAGGLLSPTTFTLLVPGGRKERYWATLALAVVGSLLLVGIAGSIALLSEVFAIFLAAAFSWGNTHGLLFGQMGPAVVLLPCLLVPVALGVGLIDHKHEMISEVFGGLVLISLVLTPLWYRRRPDLLGRELFAGVFVFGCIFFLFTLRAACRRWDVR
jgi:hypothetical protein